MGYQFVGNIKGLLNGVPETPDAVEVTHRIFYMALFGGG